MKVIVNKEQKDIPISFEGFDYLFSAGKPAQVEDDVFNFIQELLPMSFDFKPDLSKIKTVAPVPKTPTHNVFPGGKFGVQSANLTKVNFPNTNVNPVADELPGSGNIDTDGVEFYGKGLEDDKV